MLETSYIKIPYKITCVILLCTSEGDWRSTALIQVMVLCGSLLQGL